MQYSLTQSPESTVQLVEVQCRAMNCGVVQWSEVECTEVQYILVQCSTVLYSAVHFGAV